MNAGKLDKQIKFVKYKQAKDGSGGSTPVPEVVYTTNASVKPLKQQRTVQANQSQLQGGYELWFRWRPDVTPLQTWDIQYNGKVLTINSIELMGEDKQKGWFIIAMHKQ